MESQSTVNLRDDISIIMPAKNEAATLPSLLSELLELYPNAEIIVVNDGSKDATLQCLIAAFSLRPITRPRDPNVLKHGEILQILRSQNHPNRSTVPRDHPRYRLCNRQRNQCHRTG